MNSALLILSSLNKHLQYKYAKFTHAGRRLFSFARNTDKSSSTYSDLGIDLSQILNYTYENRKLAFACSSDLERYRVETLETKEPGTVKWIKEYCQPGDTFYDVGANIGLYTILAAIQVGPSGQVYAFEPHSINFVSLLKNLVLNNLANVVSPISCGLSDSDKIDTFNYKSLGSGTSDSQIGTNLDMKERIFEPAFKETKICLAVDTLVFHYQLPSPTHVKIDVDGNEMLILRGMARLLSSPRKPRSVQVEINRRYREEIFSFMTSVGYRLVTKHYTASGLKKLEKAQSNPKYNQDLIPFNAVFAPI